MHTPQNLQKPKPMQSLYTKLAVVVGLIIIFVIPSFFLMDLVSERQTRRDQVFSEMSSQWGGDQNIVGPILVLPYKTPISSSEYREVRYGYYLPDTQNIKSSVATESRSRGIYENIVYSTDIEISGSFTPDPNELSINPDFVLWDEAELQFIVSDKSGLLETITVDWEGSEIEFESGDRNVSTASIDLSTNQESYAFNLKAKLKGSGRLTFSPIGKETSASITSNWSTPGFMGASLPVSHSINDEGFDAEWKTLSFTYNIPHAWLNIDSGQHLANLSQSNIGVEFYQPVDIYQTTERSLKYSILFIALTFIFFFFVEVLSKTKKKIHPIQYALVGFAISIFYLLLLSLAEHIPFYLAYIVAAASVLIIIAGYLQSMYKSIKITALMSLLLAALYGFLYTTLESQDYALLIGSIGLFVILATIMFVTRKINWYELGK